MATIEAQIQLRRDTQANWSSVNPVLASGEVGVDLDNDLVKIGDGVTAWNALAYNGTSGIDGINGTSGTSGSSGISGTSGTSGVNGTSGISPNINPLVISGLTILDNGGNTVVDITNNPSMFMYSSGYTLQLRPGYFSFSYSGGSIIENLMGSQRYIQITSQDSQSSSISVYSKASEGYNAIGLISDGNSALINRNRTYGPTLYGRGISGFTYNVFSLQSATGYTDGQITFLTPIVAQSGLTVSKQPGTGIKVDTTNPTFGYKDLIGQIVPATGGAANPTLANFRGTNVKAYSFAANNMIDNIVFHLPHDYVPNTPLYIHTHWSHNGTAISGNFTYEYYVMYSKGYNQSGETFNSEITLSKTINITGTTDHPQYGHFIDEQILTSATGSTNTLDVRKIEVDGLIIVALKVITIPTITGSTSTPAANKPFIFTVDIHYQSTGILGTKDKNYPFYQ